MIAKIVKDRPNQFVFVSALSFMCLIFARRIPSDFVVHAFYVQWFEEGKNILPANFLYYFFVIIFSGFSKNFTIIMGATALVAAIFITLKFYITRLFLQRYFELSQETMLWFSTSLLIIMSLPSLEILEGGKAYFLPQLPPNTWHNSTLVCLFPFGIALFSVSFESIFKQNKKTWLYFTVLIILNLLIKPSYFLVLIMAFPLSWIWFEGVTVLSKKVFWFHMIPLALGLMILAIQHQFLYNDVRSVYYLPERTEGAIAIKPFHVWHGFSQNIPMSFILSLAFPICFLSIWYKKVIESKLLQYLLITSFFSLSIFIIVSETNEHEYCKNYSWQLYITNYLLFTVCGAMLFEKIRLRKWQSLSPNEKIAFILYLLHILSGLLYFLKMFVTKSYR